MFAVPGWAVSADALTLQGAAKGARSDLQRSQEQAFADSKSKSKKRKRPAGEPPSSSKVSAEDLERLWNKQFGNEAAGARSKRDEVRPSSKVVRSTPVEDESQHTVKKTQSQQLQQSPSSRPDDASATQMKPAEQNVEVGKKAVLRHYPESGIQRKEKTRKRDKRKHQEGQKQADTLTDERLKAKPNATPTLPPPPPPPSSISALTPLQAKMRAKLTSARFRHLNQTLYTTTSTSALSLFSTSPDLFLEYHAGFSQQVRDSWPLNPVDVYIRSIKSRGLLHEEDPDSLPRRKTGTCTIADLGCGDAPLARGCQSKIKDLKLKFHNFDLHSPNSHVSVADISALPLRDGEADIAVFCLSLMGTNWLSFVEEAWRVLRGDGSGEVWVAEVKSRFGRVGRGKGKVVQNSVGKRRKVQKPKEDEEEVLVEVDGEQTAAADETDITAFVDVFHRRGFVLKPDSVSKGNKMFVSMVFVKSGIPSTGKHKGKKWFGREYKVVHDGKMRFADDHDEVVEEEEEEEARVLKPCVYKTR